MLPNEAISVTAPEVSLPDVTSDNAKPPISVSLKYWHAGSECISEWGRDDLKKLRKFIDKIQSLTWSQIKADGGLGYVLHKGPPKGHGFSRPSSISKDQSLVEMKITGKARVHGIETDEAFFLVWLDRNHAVFPGGK
jgi:hypothetical protein